MLWLDRDGVALAYDEQGQGDPPHQRCTMQGGAADLAWMCEALGAERPVVVGHSLQPGLMLARTVGSGHFSPLEVPGQVNAIVERFLEVGFLDPVRAVS